MLGYFLNNIFAAPMQGTSLAPILHNILPTIVNIRAQIKMNDVNLLNQLGRPNPGFPETPTPDTILSVGSGVIVDAANGYVITNAHVVADAQTVTVTLGDGHHYTAKIIGLDKPSDIALLKIKAKGLSAIKIGNSNDLKVGDLVAAIGNPFGLSQTVTSGIVSALDRTALGIENYENFIQTDAPINPGNSGGALINMQGELIGINTAILAPDRGSVGVGFAIPSNMAQSVMQQLIVYGNVRRGVLGVVAQDITPDLATAFKLNNTKGAVITQIYPHTPAENAGLHIGDIITTIDKTNIKNANDVVNAVGLIRVDSKTNINILRKGKIFNLSTILTDPIKRKENEQLQEPYFFGVSLQNFNVLSAQHGEIKGILVVSVDPDTNAWHSDLRAGDIITYVNETKVTSIDELKKIAANTKDNLLLNVIRGRGAIFLLITRSET